MCTHTHTYVREGRVRHRGRSPCRNTVHVSAVAVIPNSGDFFGGKGGKPKPGCLQRHLFSSACLVSGCRPPSQGGPEQSSGPAPTGNHDPGNIFTRLGNAWPPTATSRSPPCPQTCWKPAQTLIFRARALVWESYS